jgi:hypothetical protein
MTEDYDSDHDISRARGRNDALRALSNGAKRAAHANGKPAEPVRNGPKPSSDSQSSGSRRNSPTRMPFTRSRSPAVHALGGAFSLPHRTQSPAVGQRTRNAVPLAPLSLLPGSVNITFRIPFTLSYWMVAIDVRQAAENCVLLVSLGYGADKLRAVAGNPFSADMWCSIGNRYSGSSKTQSS